MLKNNNLTPWQVDNLQINIIIEYYFGLYIDALPTLWHQRWGIKCVECGKTEYVSWEKTKCISWKKSEYIG